MAIIRMLDNGGGWAGWPRFPTATNPDDVLHHVGLCKLGNAVLFRESYCANQGSWNIARSYQLIAQIDSFLASERR